MASSTLWLTRFRISKRLQAIIFSIVAFSAWSHYPGTLHAAACQSSGSPRSLLDHLTEPPSDIKTQGIYIDKACGTPLFSSRDRLKSSDQFLVFSKTIAPSKISFKTLFHSLKPQTVFMLIGTEEFLGYMDQNLRSPTATYAIHSSRLGFVPQRVILAENFAIPVLTTLESRHPSDSIHHESIVLSGGGFWCLEKDFEALSGIIDVKTGYTGGVGDNPTYNSVSSNQDSGWVEAIQVTYDPLRQNIQSVLAHFWTHIDPTSETKQFCDQGNQYRSAIFYSSDQQLRWAQKSKKHAEGKLNAKIFTEITPLQAFYPAEAFHQNYAQKNPEKYRAYRLNCGRDQGLTKIWGRHKTFW